MSRESMRTRAVSVLLVAVCIAALPSLAQAGKPTPQPTPSGPPTPMQIYGVWHCSDDYCIWGTPRSVTEFDSKNHWLIDRGDGRPSVNLVILSFLHPLKLLNQTTDATTLNGVPRGFTPEIVNYFKSRGIRVMASIGGITYVDVWNQALAQNATLLGQRAAALASSLGIGIEIDWEENAPTEAQLQQLQAMITAYRAVHPYDATGSNHAARLTIDVAAGGRWLIDINTRASAQWLLTPDRGTPVLDYANAMVARQDGNPTTWQEHIDGKPTYDPPTLPKAAAKFTGGLWIHGDNDNCDNYAASSQNAHKTYVQTVQTKVGTTNGMLGYMFWAAECEGTRTVCTTPPNTCEGGVGVGATQFNIPIPMPPLRQQ
jgi:hypothetical protein